MTKQIFIDQQMEFGFRFSNIHLGIDRLGDMISSNDLSGTDKFRREALTPPKEETKRYQA